jgi:hypothetical protein
MKTDEIKLKEEIGKRVASLREAADGFVNIRLGMNELKKSLGKEYLTQLSHLLGRRNIMKSH